MYFSFCLQNSAKGNIKHFVNGPGLPVSYEAFSSKTPPDQVTSAHHSVYIRIKLDSLNDSLIFFVGNGFEDNTPQTINFLSLSVYNQRLAFMYSTGPEHNTNPGVRGLVMAPDIAEVNVWYSINLHFYYGNASLQINGGTIYRNSSVNNQRSNNMTLSDWIYIGSLNNMNHNPTPNITTGFSGCVSHLDVDNYTYHLTNDRLEESNVLTCEDACQLNDCKNQATCRIHPSDVNYYYCQCSPGYYDYLCNTTYSSLADPCYSAPCLNGGTCVSTPNSSYTCQCPLPYAGTTNCDSSRIYIQINKYILYLVT